MYSDAQLVKAAHEADEKKDEDGDGVPDVQQITPAQLVQRKVMLRLEPSTASVATLACAAPATSCRALF